MRVSVEAGVVRKVAGDDAERQRLGTEASMLSLAAHPGVVRLIATAGGDPPSELVLAPVGGGSLATIGRSMDWSEVAGLGAALATTLADLHEIGIVHGSISADHILLDESGRPVLCGFGRAVRCDLPESRAVGADDVASLAALLQQFAEGPPPRSVGRLLWSFSGGRQMGRARTARRLARRLIEAVPSARLPGVDAADGGTVGHQSRHEPRPNRERVPRRRRLPALVLVTGCAVGFLLLLSESRAGGDHAHAVASGSVLSSPSGKFTLIGTSGLEVIGHWHCGGPGAPALLDLRGGNVWVFDGWPTDATGISARLVARVPQAVGLRVVRGTRAASRCDELLVERRRQTPKMVNPSQ
ncbi:MAG TPA: protein kinase [Acidimicrobiales bacterium]